MYKMGLITICPYMCFDITICWVRIINFTNEKIHKLQKSRNIAIWDNLRRFLLKKAAPEFQIILAMPGSKTEIVG